MIHLAGEALYLAGLVFAESLRFRRRIERLGPQSTGRSSVRRSRLAELLVLSWVLLGIWFLPSASTFTPWLEDFDFVLPLWAVGGGAALFSASLALRWRAQVALGREWSRQRSKRPQSKSLSPRASMPILVIPSMRRWFCGHSRSRCFCRTWLRASEGPLRWGSSGWFAFRARKR